MVLLPITDNPVGVYRYRFFYTFLSEPPNGRFTMRLCAPIVHCKAEHAGMAWCVPINPDAANGLSKQSTADAAQTRALDTVRFVEKLGTASATKLQAILTALAATVDYTPAPAPNAAPKL